MGFLLKCAVLISWLLAGWTVTPIIVAECSVYPLDGNGGGGGGAQNLLLSLDSVSPVLQKSLGMLHSLSLSFTFPDDLEVNEYCSELLRIFGQRYVAFANCLVSYARPVKICQNCYVDFSNLGKIYKNISDELGPGNLSCHDSLIRSDRLMLLYTLLSQLDEVWTIAECKQCLVKEKDVPPTLSNVTLFFMDTLNQSLSCFEKYQGNHSELCKDCKASYKSLNELYGRMEKNQSLCIDIEDAMNMTRRLWSKNYSCSFPREETVPVIAVSSFMLFLPIIFYLSSFLHSEQKKRKLIHPKRAKSSSSLMNIQDQIR